MCVSGVLGCRVTGLAGPKLHLPPFISISLLLKLNLKPAACIALSLSSGQRREAEVGLCYSHWLLTCVKDCNAGIVVHHKTRDYNTCCMNHKDGLWKIA